MNIYIIYDRKAETVKSLFSGSHHVEAIRGVAQAGSQPGSLLADYPDDFELRCVGSVDPRTGIVQPLDVPAVIGLVSNLVSASKNDETAND